MCMQKHKFVYVVDLFAIVLHGLIIFLSDPDHPASVMDTLSIPTPHIDKLWTFVCPLTKRRKVTCMAWNPVNKVRSLLIQ